MGDLHIHAWRNRKTVCGLALLTTLILVLTSMNSIAQDSTLRQPAAGPISGQIDLLIDFDSRDFFAPATG